MRENNNLDDKRLDAETNVEEKAPMSMENASIDISRSLGMIGRLPNFTGIRQEDGLMKKHADISKCNRYLSYQESRIDKALKARNFAKAVLIGLMLLKISRTYQLVLFNRCCKGGYGRFSANHAEKLLFKAMNKIRSWDMTLLINRYYIEKKNGKFRPIGAPNYESRMISKALTDLVYSMTENDRSEEQHAYVRRKGAGSAVHKVVMLLREGYSGYEFDLKSFFNTVEPFIIHKRLADYNREITKLISNIIKNIEYRGSMPLKKESELHFDKQENIIVRTGMPQGLSLSPVLSTGALEYYCRPKNLIMYADDGIYFYRNNITAFTDGMEKMGKAGIEIAPEKSGNIGKKFEFVGFEFDTINKTVSCNGEVKGWRDPDLIPGAKTVNNSKLYIKNSDWKGEVHKEALILHRKCKMSILELLKTLGKSLGKGEMYKGYKGIPSVNRIVHIYSASTGSNRQMLKTLIYKKHILAKISPFGFNGKVTAFDFDFVEKGRYINYLPEYMKHKSTRKAATKYFEKQEFYNLRRSKMKLMCR